jgi:ribonuclease D
MLVVLRELAAWRERTARERNLPRPWIIRDESLIEIAQHQPGTEEKLAQVRKINLNPSDSRAVLDLVRLALALPKAQWPEPPPKKLDKEGHESLVALLQALLRLRCEDGGVAMKFVANRADLDRLATEDSPDIPALSGWRRKFFGDDALALVAGRLALTGDGDGDGVIDLNLNTPDS